MLLTIIVVILVLGLLIFSHELGHFISAKKAGMQVEEFGFGFPPRIFSIKKGETIYSLNLIPIGGFVRIKGENGGARGKRAFCNKPIWKRAIVLAMGVIMNLFLAAILLSIVYGIGIPTLLDENNVQKASNIQVQVMAVAPGSPAEIAGIEMGDGITDLKAQSASLKITEVEDIQEFVARQAGEEVTLTIKRGEEVLTKTLLPRISPPDNEGPIGVALAKTGTISYPWYSAILEGFKRTGQLVVIFIGMFYQLIRNLIFNGALMGQIAGPIGIVTLTSQMTKLGLVYLLQFTAILSINLAILNSIPFPALDGGRLLFLLIEKIKGSPINAKIEQTVNSIGFLLLIALMIVITYKDILRLF